MKLNGKLISFEGGEGSGKSSLLSRLKDETALSTYKILYSFEPGGSELGQEIRQSLIKPRAFVSPRAEALLYAAARAQHVDEVIVPALAQSTHVFLDRYVDASLAYQGVARELGLKRIRDLNEWAMNSIYPDRTYYLDIDPETGLKRAKGRQSLDRIEQESMLFHAKIREAYQHLAKADPARFIVIDASKTADEVFSNVLRDLLGYLPKNGS
ncbi:MAG: dTMP kinase [Bdellovibrionota bacterium]